MTSCDFFKNNQNYNEANEAIYNLYVAYNNDESIEEVVLENEKYGKYNKLVDLESE